MNKLILLIPLSLFILLSGCITINSPLSPTPSPTAISTSMDIIKLPIDVDNEYFYIFNNGQYLTKPFKTHQGWRGNGPQSLSFSIEKYQFVLNAGYEPAPNRSHNFKIHVYKMTKDYKIDHEITGLETYNNIFSVFVDDMGSYKVDVESSECYWWVKLGYD